MTDARWILRWLGLLLSALLGACGPGTGGTGTGPGGADVLAPYDPSLVAPAPWLGEWVADGLRASLTASTIDVQERCRLVRYEGPWALDGEGRAALDGFTRDTALAPGTAGVPVAEPAPVRLLLHWQGDRLVVSAVDAQHDLPFGTPERWRPRTLCLCTRAGPSG